MFVGHGLLAFAIVASLASRWGAGRDRALAVGLLAAGFATVPDVDVIHPLVALLVQPVALADAPAAFWTLSTEVHRTATHSLVVGLVAAAGLTALAAARGAGRSDPRGGRIRNVRGGLGALGVAPLALVALVGFVGVVALVGLVGAIAIVDEVVAAAVVAAMVLAALALVAFAGRAGIGVPWIGLAAAVGLLSHPFGDLLTGQPPPLLYPLGIDVIAERVTLHPDPALHLLGAFLVELGTAWLALAVLARLYDVRLGRQVGVRASAGVGYAGAALVLPAPSLSAASAFVLTVLAVGLVGAPLRPTRPGARWRTATTALSAVTLAALAYGAAYLAL